MLTIVPPPDRFTEARELLWAVEELRVWTLAEVLLPLLLGVCLLAAGSPQVGGLLLGVAAALALSRFGPSWWPGRR